MSTMIYTGDMSVKDYYCSHFDELPAQKKFHFATRMKNWCSDGRFDGYLEKCPLDDDLEKVWQNNDYSRVNNLEVRRPYFEKYENIYALEATLCLVDHLLAEYGTDRREALEKIYSREQLYDLSDRLMADFDAVMTLTTYAVNVICLTEILFPRGKNVFQELIDKTLTQDTLDEKIVYLITHVMICETEFYVKPIRIERKKMYQQALEACEQVIAENYDAATLDLKLEFLVCAKMVGYESGLKDGIAEECNESLKSNNWVKDPRKPDRLNTFEGAEHRNVLYIMSGLDG